jgi:Glycosyl transferase family, a/b domain
MVDEMHCFAVGVAEPQFSATVPVAEVAKTETYTRAYADANGFMTLSSNGKRVTGAYAVGPEPGEWLQQAMLAICAQAPLDVLAEITTSWTAAVASVENGEVKTFEIAPEDVGLKRAKAAALRGGDADQNAKALMAVLKGERGPFRDIAMLNAAAALVVAGKATDLKSGIALAQKSIDSGEAEARLDRLVVVSGS